MRAERRRRLQLSRGQCLDTVCLDAPVDNLSGGLVHHVLCLRVIRVLSVFLVSVTSMVMMLMTTSETKTFLILLNFMK